MAEENSLFKEGMDLYKTEKYEEAIELHTKAIDLDSDFTRAYGARASVYAVLGRLVRRFPGPCYPCRRCLCSDRHGSYRVLIQEYR